MIYASRQLPRLLAFLGTPECTRELRTVRFKCLSELFRVVLPFVLLIGLAQGQGRQVCLEDHAALNTPTLGSFYQEFRALVGARGIELSDSGCQPDAIRLSLYQRAEGRAADVLGAARVDGQRVSPQLEVYLDPVVAMMPETHCWNVVGRALARVAAHEVAHFIDQDQQHSKIGLLRARFPGAQLASDDSYPFRWIRAERSPPGPNHIRMGPFHPQAASKRCVQRPTSSTHTASGSSRAEPPASGS
jgi:hypothetical protein